jgi:hypothetical protein
VPHDISVSKPSKVVGRLERSLQPDGQRDAPLDAGAKALALLERRAARGKTVLTVRRWRRRYVARHGRAAEGRNPPVARQAVDA